MYLGVRLQLDIVDALQREALFYHEFSEFVDVEVRERNEHLTKVREQGHYFDHIVNGRDGRGVRDIQMNHLDENVLVYVSEEVHRNVPCAL